MALYPTKSDANTTHQCPNTTSLGKLHDDPNSRSLHQTPIVLDDIHLPPSARVHQLLQKSDLLLDIPNIIVFRVEVDDLECDYMARREMFASVYRSVGSFADDLEFLAVSSSCFNAL